MRGPTIIQRMLGENVTLEAADWRRLNMMWVGFFVLAGALNLYVAYNYDEATWVNFKLFGLMGLTLVFALLQGVWIARKAEAARRRTRADMLYVIIGKDAPGALADPPAGPCASTSSASPSSSTPAASRSPGPARPSDSADPGEAGFAGSVIIAEFESLEAARDWVAGDPYVTEGVFESYEVRPFIKVLP